MDELLWVEKLCGGDDEAAAEALEKLRPRLCRVLKGCLRDLDLCLDDIDDVLEEAVLTLWDRRCHLRFENLASFWGYARKVARSKAYKRSAVVVVDLIDEIPSSDFELIGQFLEFLLDRERIFDAADELWLRKKSPRHEWDTRLLAAQFVILNHLSPNDVVAILGPYSSVTAAQIQTWVEEISTLLGLCYSELYWQNTKLADHLMEESAHWTESDREAITLRFGKGITDDKILQMRPSLSPQDLHDLKAKCSGIFPFIGMASKLGRACQPQEPLREQGLWKRLVFQYAVVDLLPHKHILERVGIPAGEVEVKLTEAMLNAWLSNGRIYLELSKQMTMGVAR